MPLLPPWVRLLAVLHLAFRYAGGHADQARLTASIGVSSRVAGRVRCEQALRNCAAALPTMPKWTSRLKYQMASAMPAAPARAMTDCAPPGALLTDASALIGADQISAHYGVAGCAQGKAVRTRRRR